MIINNKDGQKINPATEENQETIIELMGGGTGGKTPAELSAEEIAAMAANKDLLLAALAGDFTTLQAILTGGTQKSKIVSSEGAANDPVTNAQLTSALTSGTQKSIWVDAAGIEKGDITRVFTATITCPANQNAYAPGDVITDIGGNVTSFANVAKAAGYGVTIAAVRIQSSDTGIAGKNFRLHFYNEAITPIADNAVMSILDANAAKREGNALITMGAGTLSKVGQSNYENIMFCPVGRDVYMVLEDVDGHTPSANSTWYKIFIKCILTN